MRFPSPFTFEVAWDGDAFPEIRADIEGRIDRFHRLFPRWIRKVWLRYDSGCENPACVGMREDYGSVRITFGPQYLEDSEEERDDSVLHEILHCYNVPLANKIRTVVSELELPAIARSTIEGDLLKEIEIANGAMLDLIYRLLK